MKYYTTIEDRPGISNLDFSDGSIFKYIQSFALLSLENKKEQQLNSANKELGILILDGSCDISIDAKVYENLGVRKNVFNGLPTAFYIPINKTFKIISHGVRMAICSGVCDKKTEFAIIRPESIKIMQVGKDNWQREVRIIIGPNSPSVNLILGETINPPGNWSGTPAHKHEKTNLPAESLHEELYYFKTDKPQGFGVERIYSDDKGLNELIYLKENTVTFMPHGYHQIVAGPGYTLYYLFFLSGVGKELAGCADAEHKWLNM